MRFSGTIYTIHGSTYWEDGKIISKHTNELPPAYELKLSEQARQVLKDIDELANLIVFHAKVRENAEIMSEPWEM